MRTSKGGFLSGLGDWDKVKDPRIGRNRLESSGWMAVTENSGMEINLRDGTQFKIYGRINSRGRVEVLAEKHTPEDRDLALKTIADNVRRSP